MQGSRTFAVFALAAAIVMGAVGVSCWGGDAARDESSLGVLDIERCSAEFAKQEETLEMRFNTFRVCLALATESDPHGVLDTFVRAFEAGAEAGAEDSRPENAVEGYNQGWHDGYAAHQQCQEADNLDHIACSEISCVYPNGFFINGRGPITFSGEGDDPSTCHRAFTP